MNKQITRENAAHFLEVNLENVMELEGQKPGSLKMDKVVTEAKGENHICGTVCCMDGWLPYSFPYMFEWRLNKSQWDESPIIFCEKIDGDNATIDEWPIPEIKNSLWRLLSGSAYPGEGWILGLSVDSEPETVFKVWKAVISEMRNGKWDDFLNFD